MPRLVGTMALWMPCPVVLPLALLWDKGWHCGLHIPTPMQQVQEMNGAAFSFGDNSYGQATIPDELLGIHPHVPMLGGLAAVGHCP